MKECLWTLLLLFLSTVVSVHHVDCFVLRINAPTRTRTCHDDKDDSSIVCCSSSISPILNPPLFGFHVSTTAHRMVVNDAIVTIDSKNQDKDNNNDDDENSSVVWLEDDNDNDDDNEDDNENENETESETEKTERRMKHSRWDSLNPKIKARIIKKGQERAIANKKKRESAQDKKRRLYMFVKEQQRVKKRAGRVRRPVPFTDRTPLSAMVPGTEVSGVVISVTPFGAYVDVGTECDGLLHISQLSRTEFINHPRQVVSAGDEITVTVTSTNPEQKKLHLSMLPKDVIRQEAQKAEEDDAADRIQLHDLMVDDELWGELRRVTDYGAYVEVGCVVTGFLHFMDHPAWVAGQRPADFMRAGDRVRVWVSDIDTGRNRIKLTAVRPSHLPGPRREW